MKLLPGSSYSFFTIVFIVFTVFALFIIAPLGVTSVQAQSDSANIDNVALENPIRVNTIQELLVAILNIIMILMVPVIVFFIIYAGFKYVMAQGNASQVEEATRALTYAIIGGVLILGAVAISQIIQNVVSAF